MLEDELVEDVDLDECVDLDALAPDALGWGGGGGGGGSSPSSPAAADEAGSYVIRPVLSDDGRPRILVKHPVGTAPIEMWVSLPDLAVRPPEVLECFRDRLERTPCAASRRDLDGGGLVLVNLDGDALPVTATLAAAGVADGDVLIALPSVARLRFLRAELASRVAALDAPEPAAPEPAAAAATTTSTPPRVGGACWVRMADATWRGATLALWPSRGGALAVVKWAPDSLEMDEPPLAQVEAPRVRATRPTAMLGRPPAIGDAPARPLALRDDGALVVQVVWRLGDPAEALAIWLRVPPEHGDAVRPPRLVDAFARRLAAERPRLRFRCVAASLRLCALDGAPLDDAAPVAAQLRALVARRAADDGAGAGAGDARAGDALARTWRRPAAPRPWKRRGDRPS